MSLVDFTCPRCGKDALKYVDYVDDDVLDSFSCEKCNWDSTSCPGCIAEGVEHWFPPCGQCHCTIDVSRLYPPRVVLEVQGERAGFACPHCDEDLLQQEPQYNRGASLGWGCLACAWTSLACPQCVVNSSDGQHWAPPCRRCGYDDRDDGDGDVDVETGPEPSDAGDITELIEVPSSIYLQECMHPLQFRPPVKLLDVIFIRSTHF